MPRRTLRTHPLDATETGHCTELLYDDGSNDGVVVCAAHGGRVEPGTAEQALELAVRLPAATCWARLGFDEAAEEFELYHPASTAIDPADHPLLAEIADRAFATAISLHGLADDGVLVGGGVDDGPKREVAARLDEVLATDVAVVTEGAYAGVSPENFVNWLAAGGAGGLQLEQGPDLRDDEADAVVDVLAALVADGVL